jgi:hypothetical protein
VKRSISVAVAALAVAVAAVAAPVVETGAGSSRAAGGATTAHWIRAVSATGRYFLDQNGAPVALFWDHQWNLIANAGEWKELGAGTTPRAVFASYAAEQAANGFNGVLTLAVSGAAGSHQNGTTWDGIAPFVSGAIGNLNNAYWTRVDQFIDAMAAQGITVILNLASSYAEASGGALSGLNPTNGAAYGTAIGTRYQGRPNIVYEFGVDDFGYADASYQAIADAIRATGDTHLITVQHMAESNSRTDSASSPIGTFGADADVDHDEVYSYNASYLETQRDYQLSGPTRPTLFANGHYDQSATNDDYDWHVLADNLGWALTSGSQGSYYGSEATWEWGSGAHAALSQLTFPNGPWPATIRWFTSLDGWWKLVPDFGSSFITSARGTKLAAIPSGGNGGGYDATDPQNDYLTGAVAPDGTLAVLYTPVARTISVDTTKLAAGFRGNWVDPYSGAVVAATGSGVSYSTPGPNSHGDGNWYLVLGADTPITPGPTPQPGAFHGSARLKSATWTRGSGAARLEARLVLHYVCSSCASPRRPVKLQGRLADGSWRTIARSTYRKPVVLRFRVPYRFRKVRVKVPAFETGGGSRYAGLVSNRLKVPRKPM